MRSVSIIIPAYNEQQRLPSTIETIKQYIESRQWSFVEVVVVDDGSRDSTAHLVLDAAKQNPWLRLLKNPGNRGKGYSVKHGMLDAKGDWVLFSDADLSAPIDELDKLLEQATKANAQVAIGSRALNRALVSRHQSTVRELSGRFFNLVMRTVTGLPFHDTQCGFKLFTRHASAEVFRRCTLDGFGFDVEALFIARQLNFKSIEVPVRWANVEGTKVSLLKGLDAFLDILRVRQRSIAGRYK